MNDERVEAIAQKLIVAANGEGFAEFVEAAARVVATIMLQTANGQDGKEAWMMARYGELCARQGELMTLALRQLAAVEAPASAIETENVNPVE